MVGDSDAPFVLEKIGALLKTYGVAKVSELAPSRYEAFLTDISQI